MTDQTLTIDARKFITLTSAVAGFAADDRGLPVLSAVRVESRGTYLLAFATDGYRLGIQRLKPSEGAWPEFSATIPLRVLRSLQQMFKPQRGMDCSLTLTLHDDQLTVEGDGALLDLLSARATYNVETAEYPSVPSILLDAIDREPTSDEFALNPRHLAAFSKLDGPALIVKGHGSKVILVRSGEDFIGAVMPRRMVSRDEPSLDDWKPLLVKPEKVVAKKAPAKRKGAAA